MKKLTTLMVALLLVSAASAAQINWGIQGQVKFENNLVGNEGATFTLVYLTDSTKWSSAAVDLASGKDSLVATSVATKKTNAGSMSMQNVSPWGFTWAGESEDTNIGSKVVSAPSIFAMLVTTVQDGKTYYWASDTYTVSDTDTNWNGTSQTYTMNVTPANAMGANGEKWTAVPEPSTAALALAGLALLLKRRKA